jgi:cytochrome P450
MVVMEALRLYPPASMLPRTALEDDVIDGYPIRKGAVLLLFFYGAQHHPDYWENPEQFDPDRFSPERSKNRDPFAFLTFGAGPHKCVGQEFAMLEGVMTLAMMMQRFQIDLVPDHPVVPKLVTTLRPRYGLKAYLKPV